MKMDLRKLKDMLVGLLVDLFYPRRAVCMGCGEKVGCDRNDLCEKCRRKLAKDWIGVCRPPEKSGIDGAAYAYRYFGPAGSMVRKLKYGGVGVLAEEMGRDVARAAELLRMGDIRCVTAVPMHPKRLSQRGRNHAELLARSAAEQLGLQYEELLMRTRNAPQQARLTREERKKNLRGVFCVRPEKRRMVNGEDVLLIDDVFTTGATAIGCAKALREAGARRVYFAAYSCVEGKQRE